MKSESTHSRLNGSYATSQAASHTTPRNTSPNTSHNSLHAASCGVPRNTSHTTLYAASHGAPHNISRNTPELLAPAGGAEQLAAALHFGADAVYLACERFGLRERASNFTVAELSSVVQQVHDAGARAYVTANALMGDAEIAQLPAFFEALDQAQADAVIVSDLGALRLARRHAPSLAVHVSTQASCMNAEAARAYYEMGARRIVCAREMSLADIAALRRAIPDDLELEAFVHGAMCMAVSGRCLISSFVNGRSANRGHCTQPCRWEYALVERTRADEPFPIEEDGRGSFILSSKDLNMLHHLDDLRAAGVDSIKIEGRVKKAYYVATVVNAYRQVLDGADPADFDRDLDAVSHRPYATGFYYGSPEQAPGGPEYASTHVLAARVCACEPSSKESGSFDIRFDLRNRICEGAELEALSPGVPARAFKAQDLHMLDVMANGAERLLPVSVADRTAQQYVMRCPFALAAGDMLRIDAPESDRARARSFELEV